jgi:tRNA threonylcarbamoyladenosine biosynthesis protein TsaB
LEPLRVLGIETATQVCGVALCRGEQLIAESRLNIKNVHSEKLTRLISDLAAAANFHLKALDGIAVSIGPGSFTGLRIGLSVAKGLAFALESPLVPISTLEALAAHAPALEGTVCAVLSSRRNEIFAAVFERHGDRVVRKTEDKALALADLLNEVSGPALVVGSGTHLVAELRQPHLKIAPPPFCLASPYAVARLGAEKLHRGETADIDALEPAYLKAFEPGVSVS